MAELQDEIQIKYRDITGTPYHKISYKHDNSALLKLYFSSKIYQTCKIIMQSNSLFLYQDASYFWSEFVIK
jgi:hypothetical protein